MRLTGNLAIACILSMFCMAGPVAAQDKGWNPDLNNEEWYEFCRVEGRITGPRMTPGGSGTHARPFDLDFKGTLYLNRYSREWFLEGDGSYVSTANPPADKVKVQMKSAGEGHLDSDYADVRFTRNGGFWQIKSVRLAELPEAARASGNVRFFGTYQEAGQWPKDCLIRAKTLCRGLRSMREGKDYVAQLLVSDEKCVAKKTRFGARFRIEKSFVMLPPRLEPYLSVWKQDPDSRRFVPATKGKYKMEWDNTGLSCSKDGITLLPGVYKLTIEHGNVPIHAFPQFVVQAPPKEEPPPKEE